MGALGIALSLAACGGSDGDGAAPDDGSAGDGAAGSGPDDGAGGAGGDPVNESDPTPEDLAHPQGWFGNSTISHRVDLPVAGQGSVLNAQELVNQLAGYDPGSLLRCAVASDEGYQAAIDAIGGVSWGYGVRVLTDLSKPYFMAGLPRPQPPLQLAPGTADAGNAGPAVEIVKPDIVAVTDAAALFYSRAHGLMLVDLTGAEPAFACATQLPGVVDQFFFHQGHLVAMTKQQPAAGAESYLVHIDVDGIELSFVEAVSLGEVNILDSRRFNDKLVFYTDLRLEPVQPVAVQPFPQGGQFGGGVAVAPLPPTTHRSLRVYTLGDKLVEELHDTLIDDSVSEEELISTAVTPTTPVGSVINESRRFGDRMWASDHYFAVSEIVDQTLFQGFETRNYTVCTASHVVETPYTHCRTIYQTRPNPDYVPPSASGDHACDNLTLAECLRQVARGASETIQVPVDEECTQQVRQRFVCDSIEQRSTDYPTFGYDQVTRLFIYEYHPEGFVRLDTSVHEITTAGLDALELGDSVPVLTTSTESYELSVPGTVQTLHFDGGVLYVISEGVLQVYLLDGSSLVRTATLPVVNDSLQSSLFSEDKLFLSDFGWSGGQDQSTLRVVDLTNPSFPRIDGATHSLPGGHSTIIPSRYGIFTIGAVQRFEGLTANFIKLGLFSEPYADEDAYLILAVELMGTFLLDDEAQYFSGPEQRLLLPYRGQTTDLEEVQRVSVSRIVPGEIVSEGFVPVPEAVQRVRAAYADQSSFLTFAENSIEWLRLDGAEWQPTPVLEYFQPFAVLRLDEDDNYLEVQRLGKRCKLMLANASAINQRKDATYSDPFDCGGAPSVQAYDRTLLFGATAVEFDEDAGLRVLSEAEQMTIQQRIANRQTCLLTTEAVDNVAIDYAGDYEPEDFTCVSPSELQTLQQELAAQAYPTP